MCFGSVKFISTSLNILSLYDRMSTRKKESKKYKRGAYKGGEDKKRLEKMHKENEEMYKKFSGIMEDWEEVNKKIKEKHATELKPETTPKDGFVLAAAIPIQITTEITNEKIKRQRDNVFKAVDEQSKQNLGAIIENGGKIDKKIDLLEGIISQDQVDLNTLQNAIKDVDTDAESLILDIVDITKVDPDILKYIKIYHSNIKNRITNKDVDIENVFKNINKRSNGVKDYLDPLIAEMNALKYEKNKAIEKIKSIKIDTGLKDEPIYNKYYEMLEVLNKQHITQAQIKIGYKNEDDNFDSWLKGDAKQLIELRKLVENNNKLLKEITGELEKVVANISEIKETIKNEEDDGDEVTVEIVTYPYAQQLLPKKDVKGSDPKYTNKIRVKKKGKIRDRLNEVNSNLTLLKNRKEIDGWIGKRQSKKIKAIIDKKGFITLTP